MRVTSLMAFTVPPRRPGCPSRRARPHRRRRRANEGQARERARLRAHFRAVLAELTTADVAHLSAAQVASRTELIAELVRYARAGRFPRNLDFPGRYVPYFIDAAGTRCAMAHLIESTGAAALVAQVAATRNNTLVRELAGDPTLLEWLDRSGLSASEAARIQPAYCFTRGERCFCHHNDHAEGVLEGTFLKSIQDGRILVRVDAIHGASGGTQVGQEISVAATGLINPDAVLVPVRLDHLMRIYIDYAKSLPRDGTYPISCTGDLPVLSKADAIGAMLATKKSSPAASACGEYLSSIDSRWADTSAELHCGSTDSGGCSFGAGPPASPLALGTALAIAALWWRRRRRAVAARSRMDSTPP